MVRYISIITLVFGISACNADFSSSRGFSLPAGDSKNGATVFEKLQCNDCHKLKDEPLKSSYLIATPIILGSNEGNVITHGELVTSIINPSHKIAPRHPASFTSENGQSLMHSVNDELTVSELIDLVAFLETKYEMKPYRTSDYRLYKLRQPNKSE